jgi:hypothetical protein
MGKRQPGFIDRADSTEGQTAPGGTPAHQPQPEVPQREHPLPRPEEVPADPGSTQEIPVEAPQGPGPAAV